MFCQHLPAFQGQLLSKHITHYHLYRILLMGKEQLYLSFCPRLSALHPARAEQAGRGLQKGNNPSTTQGDAGGVLQPHGR